MNGFIRKKVHSATLGERFQGLRLNKGVKLSEVSRITRIQIRHLEYLENGEYDKLPADVYTRGFVRNYSEYLGSNPDKMVALFEKEKGIQANLKRGIKKDQKKDKIKVSQFIITPKMIGVMLIFAVVLGSFFYLYRSFENFVSTPRLVIKQPIKNNETVNESHIVFEGVTDKGNELMINNNQVMVNDEGSFSEQISLQRGVNTIVIRATNRFGKENIKEYYVSSNVENDSNQPESSAKIKEEINKFGIEISARDVSVKVTVKENGEELYSGTIQPDFSQKFRVGADAKISSDDGYNTIVSVEGKEGVALGEKKEEVVDKPLNSESENGVNQLISGNENVESLEGSSEGMVNNTN